MAIIYSTDSSYKKRFMGGARGKRNNVNFSLYNKMGKLSTNAGCAVFSVDIARQCFSLKKCILGYDDEKKEILVIPNVDGNINIIQSGSKNLYQDNPCRKISMKQFLRFIGLKDEEFPQGNYPCEVDENNTVHIFLDKVKHEG